MAVSRVEQIDTQPAAVRPSHRAARTPGRQLRSDAGSRIARQDDDLVPAAPQISCRRRAPADQTRPAGDHHSHAAPPASDAQTAASSSSSSWRWWRSA